MSLFPAVLFLAASLSAQTLKIHSEFQRFDPFGQVLPMDRALGPREILSPAVARNAFASFHVALTAPPRTNYFYSVQTSPPGIFRIRLYRERFIRYGAQWIPDILEEERDPYFGFGALPDPQANIPGQTTQVYLLDIWVPPQVTPGTVRLEFLVKTAFWRVAPLEVRVLPVTMPDQNPSLIPVPLSPPEQPADANAWQALGAVPALLQLPSVRSIIWRNAQQDAALAGPALFHQIWQAAAQRSLTGPESYLKLRDLAFQVGRASTPARGLAP